MTDSDIFRDKYIPKFNVYHVHEWKITEDWENVCKTNDITKIQEFYSKFIENINQEFQKNSLHRLPDEQIRFIDYNSGRNRTVTIDYDIHERFINWSFRQIVAHNVMSSEVIDWFISLGVITENTYHFLFNTLCIIGNYNMAKLIYSKVHIDFNKKIYHDAFVDSSPWNGYIDYLRNAITHNHLEMAIWLYEQGAMPEERELIDNIYKLCMERSNDGMKEWVESLDEYNNIPNVFDSNYVNSINNVVEI